MRSALITGCTGYIGSSLAKTLIKQNWKVHGLVRKNSSKKYLKGCLDKIFLHELSDDLKCLNSIVEKSNPDIVFHLASNSNLEESSRNTINLIQSNITFTSLLVEAMLSNNVHQLINTGTHWQYDNDGNYSPINLYTATKQAIQDIIYFYTISTNLKCIHLILYDVYGPLDKRPKLLNHIVKSAGGKEPLKLTSGEQYIDYVYIDDVVNAYIIAYERIKNKNNNSNEIFSVRTEKPVKLKKVIRELLNILKIEVRLAWGEKNFREREIMFPNMTIKKLPDWEHKVNLSEGLQLSFK